MENELKRADRLAAIGELSAGIAHEIRNPLAAISGSVQLIASSAKIADSDRKLLEIVLRETDRLNKLIKDFLSYARPVVPVKTAVHARTFIADLQVLFATDVRFRSVMVEQIVPEDLFLLIDIDQFNQVLWNLLANAAEAMDGEGVVRIELFGPTSWLDAAGKDRIVRITVSDAGCGMDGEQLKRLFEPFYTTKKNGTGLGLATVYRIVEAHGGNVQVSSKKGEGTTVTISLPE
jgi:two-component system sensor histidine kinase PilS (NtrC family)